LIVIDASVLANVVGDDGDDGDRARRALRDTSGIAAPDLVDVETVAVLRKRWLAPTMTDERFAAAERISARSTWSVSRPFASWVAPTSCGRT